MSYCISDIDPIPRELMDPIDAAVPEGVTHIGFVATNIFGHVLLTEPKGHPYGVSATFSKVKVIRGEKPHETLRRCFKEQIGRSPVGIYPIPAIWVTPNSRHFYFAGMLDLEDDLPSREIHGLRWCDEDSARRRIEESKNAASKERDLGVLDAAKSMCLSPWRRVLLMLRELHLMGFERLRAPAYISGIGTWRCPIVPAYCTWRTHGGMFDGPLPYDEQLFDKNRLWHTYTSADYQKPFEWQGCEFASPRELALRFVKEKPELALTGWGPDEEYVKWFEGALELTAPNGVYYSCAEFEPRKDSLYATKTVTREIPLPPPGLAAEYEFSRFANRFADDQTQD